jgi:hypothetical protein
MSDETEISSAQDVQRAARESLDLSAVAESVGAGDIGQDAPASEPGPDADQTSTPEPEPQPATSAGGDLQPTGVAAAQVAQPAAAAPAVAPVTPKPVTPAIPSEAEMPIEDVKITVEGIEQTLRQLMVERPDVSARVRELDAQRSVIERDYQQLATLQKSLSDIETVIRETETLYKHYKAVLAKKPEDFEVKETVRELAETLNENRGLRADNKITQRELADRVERATRSFNEGTTQVRDFTIGIMRAGVEQQRAKQQERAAVAREAKDWEADFDKVWKDAKLPNEFRAEVNRYLAAYAYANVEALNGKTYAEFMRERMPDVARIYSHGRETAVASYAEAKRADAKQASPKLKPSTSDDAPEMQSPMDRAREIQRQAHQRLKQSMGA